MTGSGGSDGSATVVFTEYGNSQICRSIELRNRRAAKKKHPKKEKGQDEKDKRGRAKAGTLSAMGNDVILGEMTDSLFSDDAVLVTDARQRSRQHSQIESCSELNKKNDAQNDTDDSSSLFGTFFATSESTPPSKEKGFFAKMFGSSSEEEDEEDEEELSSLPSSSSFSSPRPPAAEKKKTGGGFFDELFDGTDGGPGPDDSDEDDVLGFFGK